MAKDRVPLGPTQWVIDSDETTLLLYVTVKQTMGTIARVKLQEHHLREDATERFLASYNGDSRDKSLAHLWRVSMALLDTSRMSELLRLERESGSNN